MKRRTYLKTCGMILVFLLFTTFTSSAARTICVDDDGPADFNTIQAAIDDANDGDTIIVSDGTYTGDGNRDIDFLGKAITLRSENGPDNCIIDCQGSETNKHRGFYFHSGEGPDSVLTGLTIANGHGPLNYIGQYPSSIGGAILCSTSSPTISNCNIRGNSASNGGAICCCEGSNPTIRNCNILSNYGSGGGIYCEDSSPIISNCVISDNIAPLDCSGGFPTCLTTFGGGLYCANSNSMITNCTITENSATDSGGGIFCVDGNSTIQNCIISYNSTEFDGGGIGCYSECVMTVRNCILWGNVAARYGPQIAVKEILGYPSFTISYSDVQGGRSQIHTNWEPGVDWGPGNIDVEPMFADTNEGDYHLKSQGGRWNSNSESWVQDANTSPCIDGGDISSPIGDEPFPNGGIINMGGYGGTLEASKSYFGRPPCEIIVAGDVNGDCIVNYLDFRLMALNWLRDENK